MRSSRALRNIPPPPLQGAAGIKRRLASPGLRALFRALTLGYHISAPPGPLPLRCGNALAWQVYFQAVQGFVTQMRKRAMSLEIKFECMLFVFNGI